MVQYEGYGIDMSLFNYKDDAYNILWDIVKDVPWVSEAYKEYCEDNELDPDGGFHEEFIRDYDDDSFCTGGIESFITKYLNKGENEPYVYDDHVIHVPATLPKDDGSRKNLITTTQIDEQIKDLFIKLARYGFLIKTGWYTIKA